LNFAKSNRLEVVHEYGNHAVVDVAGRVDDIQKTFHVTLVCCFISLVWLAAKQEDGPSSGLQAGARRRGCDRSTLGPFESEAQLDPFALLRPELEPLLERRLNRASSYLQE